MRMRFPLYPVVDAALVETNAKFGVDITKPVFPSAEQREIADRFDVKKELEKAIMERQVHKHFGLGFGSDKEISLWCQVEKVEPAQTKFFVINGGWYGHFSGVNDTLVCYAPGGNTEHKITRYFFDDIPKFRNECYNEAIAWMNGKLDDPTPYLVKELPANYFDDMDDDIPF